MTPDTAASARRDEVKGDLGRYRTEVFCADEEAHYLAAMSRFYAPVLRATVSFTVLFYIGYLLSDRLLFQRFAGTGVDLLMLGIAAPASVLGIAATFTRLPDRRIRQIVFAATLVNGLCQAWAHDLGYRASAPTPHEGMLLVMCFAYFLLGMQYRWAAVLSLLIATAHLLLGWRSGMAASLLFDRATMMGSVVLIGLMAGHLQDLLSRRNWIHERRLRELSERDPLTGLHNRRHFDAVLQTRVAEHGRSGHGFALLILDLDHFKQINDQFGHDAGDRVLQQIATLLRDLVDGNDEVFRLGGEEFAVIIAARQARDGSGCAERIRGAAEAMTLHHDGRILPAITLSLGTAHYPADARSVAELIQKADAALYVAKRSGRNQVSNACASAPAGSEAAPA